MVLHKQLPENNKQKKGKLCAERAQNRKFTIKPLASTTISYNLVYIQQAGININSKRLQNQVYIYIRIHNKHMTQSLKITEASIDLSF